jgi:hypothetical protein
MGSEMFHVSGGKYTGWSGRQLKQSLQEAAFFIGSFQIN